MASAAGIGQPVTVAGGTLWAFNGNKGTIYLFTPDGFFVATLFTDNRLGPHWVMPKATRGLLLNGITHHEEDFFPTLNQTADGRVYLVVGQTHSSLVRVDGLDTLSVTLREEAPIVDGTLDDWADAAWVRVGQIFTGGNDAPIQAAVPTAGDLVPFKSPWRTVTMAEVAQVPDVELPGAQGNFELSVPLAALGLLPQPGLRLRGDIGILRGSGGLTTQRLYWQNKATGLVSDVPGEAELAPQLWGWWKFGTP